MPCLKAFSTKEAIASGGTAAIGKAASGVADCRFSERWPVRAGHDGFKEEQAGILLGRICSFFSLRIDVQKDGLADVRTGLQGVDNLHGLVRVDVIVPGEPQVFQRAAAPVTRIHGKEQTAEALEGRIGHHIGNLGSASVGLLYRDLLRRIEEREGIVDELPDGIEVVLPALLLVI